MLLPGGAYARLAETVGDGVASDDVGVELRDVVKLALEQLAGGVFALAGDFADAGDGVEDALERGRG